MDNPDSPELSIIFPAYNEAGSIVRALEAAGAYVEAVRLDAEIIVVDDGSGDGTGELVREAADGNPRIRLLEHSPNRGKGYAVREGMLNARGARRVFLDVDLATPVEDIGTLLAALEDGAQVASGSRHLPESRVEIPQRFRRRLMGSVFRWLARIVLGLRITDFTYGFKGFASEAAERLFSAQRETGWAFDAELLYLAAKWDLSLREVPVTWRDTGDSTVRPLQAARESLAALFRIRRNYRRGVYDQPRGPEA